MKIVCKATEFQILTVTVLPFLTVLGKECLVPLIITAIDENGNKALFRMSTSESKFPRLLKDICGMDSFIKLIKVQDDGGTEAWIKVKKDYVDGEIENPNYVKRELDVVRMFDNNPIEEAISILQNRDFGVGLN